MGQPVTVVEEASSRPGVVRFSTNRVLSGMAHESYSAAPDPLADRPVDELARIFTGVFARGPGHRPAPPGFLAGAEDEIDRLFR